MMPRAGGSGHTETHTVRPTSDPGPKRKLTWGFPCWCSGARGGAEVSNVTGYWEFILLSTSLSSSNTSSLIVIVALCNLFRAKTAESSEAPRRTSHGCVSEHKVKFPAQV
eukprot:3533572-Rhodomonas_salina.1